MTRSISRLIGLGAVSGIAMFAPVSVDPGAFGGASQVIRLSEACSQVTECKTAAGYTCVTANGNEYDQKCSRGCGTSYIEEPEL